MTAGRIALLVTGGVVSLLALAALAGGVALVVANHSERDSDGFFTSSAHSYRSGGYALVSDNLDVGTHGPDWLFEEGRLATLRLRGSSADGQRLFIGVAPTQRVNEYLRGTAFDRVTDLELDPFSVKYETSKGERAPAPPAAAGFWNATSDGAGRQSLEWDVAKGDWSAVVMNANASRGLDVRVSLGAQIGWIFWVAVGLLVAGGVLLVSGAATIYVGMRRRRVAAPPVISPTG